MPKKPYITAGDVLREGAGLPPHNPQYANFRHGQQAVRRLDDMRTDVRKLVANTQQRGMTPDQARAHMAPYITGYIDRSLRAQESTESGIRKMSTGISEISETVQEHLPSIDSNVGHLVGIAADGFSHLKGTQNRLVQQGDELVKGVHTVAATVKDVGLSNRLALKSHAAALTGAPVQEHTDLDDLPLSKRELHLLAVCEAYTEPTFAELKVSKYLDPKLLLLLHKTHNQKSLLEMVRDGEIGPYALEQLCRAGKLRPTIVEQLMELDIVRNRLGTTMRMNRTLERSEKTLGQQLEVMHVQVGQGNTMIELAEEGNEIAEYSLEKLMKLIGIGRDQLKELEDQNRSLEAIEQTGRDHLEVSTRNLGIQEQMLSVSAQRQALLQHFSASVLDTLNFGNVLTQSIDETTELLLQEMRTLCSAVPQGFERLTEQLGLQHVQLKRSLAKLSDTIFSGMIRVTNEQRTTNALLERLATSTEHPHETATREAVLESMKLFRVGIIQGGVNRLLKTEPDSHPHYEAHFLLGAGYILLNDMAKAKQYMELAFLLAVDNKDLDIAEDSAAFLANVAIQEGDLEKAEKILQQLSEDKHFSPHIKRTHVRYAAVLAALGKLDKSILNLVLHLLLSPEGLEGALAEAFIESLLHNEQAPQWEKMTKQAMEGKFSHNGYRSLCIFLYIGVGSTEYARRIMEFILLNWNRTAGRRLFAAAIVRDFRAALPHLPDTFLEDILFHFKSDARFTWLTF
jgi:tetratricopeptide (TPR) repeat protein